MADNGKISIWGKQNLDFVFSFFIFINERRNNIDKKIIIREIIKCAKNYYKNLNNRNIMFIYLQNRKIEYLETKFLKSNFLHLTGIDLKDKEISAKIFYNKCIMNKIKECEIQERKDGNTRNKLSVLNNLMFIHKNAKIVGDYNQDKIFLISNKIIGNVTSCLGFIVKGKYYICNTSLKEDIRKLTYNTGKVICIMRKKIQDLKYSEITYIDEQYKEQILSNKKISNKIEIS